ncbi:hypothetical protein D6C77_03873 [Aureobasidium pullulans]|uniref:Uncharacterized protein n=1 Tax=Aureobasidium pullulans TaxID=5580 RepID=A0AB74JN37_AURPU|nr:hypothetical protein D6D12_07672 [Aureobasidium pullulans]TIA60815.1 hypothetical protein D6C77_03873 [Aureobasidium pullulans]
MLLASIEMSTESSWFKIAQCTYRRYRKTTCLLTDVLSVQPRDSLSSLLLFISLLPKSRYIAILSMVMRPTFCFVGDELLNAYMGGLPLDISDLLKPFSHFASYGAFYLHSIEKM